jgi:tetratricopeptide (TPR) repeat protein
MSRRLLIGAVFVAMVLAQPGDALNDALNLLNAGKYQESADILSAYLKDNPDSATAYRIQAIAEFMLGRSDSALTKMQRSIELNPNQPDSFYYLGRLHFSKNRPSEALTAFQKALELDPSSVRTMNNLGQTYEALGKFSEAEKAYRDAISLNDKNTRKSEWPSYNLGALYLSQGQAEQAVPYFSQALAYKPDFIEAKIKLGVGLSKTGKPSEARKVLEDAVRVAPDNPEAHYRLGLLLMKSGSTKEAEDHLEKFRQLTRR